jgi:hypothetical protein
MTTRQDQAILGLVARDLAVGFAGDEPQAPLLHVPADRWIVSLVECQADDPCHEPEGEENGAHGGRSSDD